MNPPLQFKVTLLSDVILNVKAATEGNNETLDFIPGNNFLGIVAQNYDAWGDDALTIFHSGKVRFGDAHPVTKDATLRSLRVPAAMYHPKDETDTYYIHHLIDKVAVKDKQLKQCRTGFYQFDSNKAQAVATPRSFAIKSAYDREQRRSKDEQMFGYESLRAGAQFFFEVEVDDNALAEKIKNALIGEKHIGRSRTAQYGWIKIEEAEFNNVLSREDSNSQTVVYADSRLIFFDEKGIPTFCPTPEQLGVVGGKIDWAKSQIRTFEYAPWNFKRQTRDADRCGIEKGSVFVITGAKTDKRASKYVGRFNNEGFGKVIYNPDFLSADNEGKATYTLTPPVANERTEVAEINGTTPLLQFVKQRKEQEECEATIYRLVNDFAKDNSHLFKNERFASQWGKIRAIAMAAKTDEDVKKGIMEKEKGYLKHGVAQSKWEGRPEKELNKFLEEPSLQGHLREAVINLSSLMAKKSKKQ